MVIGLVAGWLARAGWFVPTAQSDRRRGRHCVGGDAGRRTTSYRAFGGVTGSSADLFVAGCDAMGQNTVSRSRLPS